MTIRPILGAVAVLLLLGACMPGEQTPANDRIYGVGGNAPGGNVNPLNPDNRQPPGGFDPRPVP